MSQLQHVALLADHQKRKEPAQAAPSSKQAPWPLLPPEALHGPAGRFVETIAPQTEADPAGILVQLLVMFGNLVGRGPHFKVEADEHHLNLFAVLVGASAKGRKGVSSGQAKRLLHSLDSHWFEQRILHGLSSGEGLIWAVRDPIEKQEPVRQKGRATGDYQSVITDHGIQDKRLLVLESELASTLRVLRREGNILSATIRNAWDSGSLRTLTKNAPAQATGAHISIIGHITKDELIRYLDSTEAANGFANRFLWCCVRRARVLPEGGEVHRLDFEPLVRELGAALRFARQCNEIRRDPDSRRAWAEVYPQLSEAKPGLLGSMIGRAEAQTTRLACLYAVLDRSPVVRPQHLLAALALWTYCEDSARWIFGEALGDPVADEILRALRGQPAGMSRTQISQLFGRHRKAHELSQALCRLAEQGLAIPLTQSSGGRPTERWQATQPGYGRGEQSEESP